MNDTNELRKGYNNMINIINKHNCIRNKKMFVDLFECVGLTKCNILYVEKYAEFVPFTSIFAAATDSTVYGCSFNKSECFEDEFQRHYKKYFKFGDNLKKGFDEKYQLLIFGDVEPKDDEEENYPFRFKDMFHIYKNNLDKDCIILYKPADRNDVPTFKELEILQKYPDYILYKVL